MTMKVYRVFVLFFFCALPGIWGEALPRGIRSDDAVALTDVVANLASSLESLQSQVASLSQKVDDQQRTIADQRQKIAQLEAASSHRVAFTATAIEGQNIPAVASQTILFRNVLTNVGSAYSSSTGAFTAPVDGVYVFLINVDVSHDYEAVDLARNGHTVSWADKDDTVVTHISGSVVINLKAGDIVICRHTQRDTGYIEGGTDSTFSGFFLY